MSWSLGPSWPFLRARVMGGERGRGHRAATTGIKGPSSPSPPLFHRHHLLGLLPFSLHSSQLALGSSSHLPTKHNLPQHLCPLCSLFLGCFFPITLFKSLPTNEVALLVHAGYTNSKFKAAIFPHCPNSTAPPACTIGSSMIFITF